MIEKLHVRLLANLIAVAMTAGVVTTAASTIGTNPPAASLTRERIAQLPLKDQSAWLKYLERSEQQRKADKAFFQGELKRAGISTPTEPPHGYSVRAMPLDRAPSWYASAEARHIADVIVSFQTPAGGWGKNLDMSKDLRRPGESFVANNLSKFLSPDDFDAPADPNWNYVGTLDNDATTTQLNFLARTISAVGAKDSETYRAVFLRGMNYLFEAQFPNGGWPQVWPLEGGYHDAITYNDGAMTDVLEIMRQTANGLNEFSFVPKSVRSRASLSFSRGIRCIFAAQIVVDATPTAWPQQEDPLTRKAVSGRNYEPPALCASESASLLIMLMDALPHPTAAEQRSIRAAAEWLRKTAIYGQNMQRTSQGRELVPTPGAGPIWARFYQIGTNLLIFGDRDKSIHDNLNELSSERRNGYKWYGADAQLALDRFEKWNAEQPQPK